MTAHLKLIQQKLQHLQRMQRYLAYSENQVKQFLGLRNGSQFSEEQHADLAAFRVRFSEFQEHLGKTMRAIAVEEEKEVEGFGAVLSFMEKLNIIESAEKWKSIRELRNLVNHEYEEDPERLARFFSAMLENVAVLYHYHTEIIKFCSKAYHI